MEYVEEESRPRFLFQSHRPMISVSNSQTLNRPTKLHIVICSSISILLTYISFSSYFSLSQTLTFFLVWTSLSLLLSPFAPSSLTGGDPRVRLGDPLPPPPPPPPPPSDAGDPLPTRRIRSRNRPETSNPPTLPTRSQDPIRNEPRSEPKVEEEQQEEESNEWTEDDFEILKKQILKHPVGAPRRWEKIAQAFNGRHGLESVIKMGKSMGERRPEDKDSFAQFLKQRKPLDKRVVEENDNGGKEEVNGKEKCWSSSEDIALLNALKAFPKDVSMRWEKVAAAVPGRSKGECVKRVSELKRDFRSSKASES